MEGNKQLRAMARAALSGSSAHALGRMMSARSLPLKAMWAALLAAGVAGLACMAGPLAARLAEGRVSETRRLDAADFQFPDVYLCPSYPYSGSIPYTLSRSEAKELNDEIDRVGAIFDRWEASAAARGGLAVDDGAWEEERALTAKVASTRATVRLDLLRRYILQTPEQSVPLCWLTAGDFQLPVRVRTFAAAGHQQVCFQPDLEPARAANLLTAGQTGLSLHLVLLTDPYFADFTYSGTPIKYISRGRDPRAPSQPLEAKEKQFLLSNAFTLVVVPQGAYPSVEHVATVQLSPGNFYRVSLRMERRQFAQELRGGVGGGHCRPGDPPLAYRDPESGERREYKYSLASCLDLKASERAVRRRGCQPGRLPLFWRLRGVPRCGNLSEMRPDRWYEDFARREMERGNLTLAADLMREQQADLAACLREQQCDSVAYDVNYSFGRWPTVATSAVGYFADLRLRRGNISGGGSTPALDQLQSLARRIDSVYHLSHDEAVFRAYTSDSLIRLAIGAKSTGSGRVTLAWEYPMTSFLADCGGLLGLCLGCSLLTAFEAVDLLLSLLMARRALHRGSGRHAGAGGGGSLLRPAVGASSYMRY